MKTISPVASATKMKSAVVSANVRNQESGPFSSRVSILCRNFRFSSSSCRCDFSVFPNSNSKPYSKFLFLLMIKKKSQVYAKTMSPSSLLGWHSLSMAKKTVRWCRCYHRNDNHTQALNELQQFAVFGINHDNPAVLRNVAVRRTQDIVGGLIRIDGVHLHPIDDNQASVTFDTIANGGGSKG